MTPEPQLAVIDHDNRTVTVTYTLTWAPGWSIDKCCTGGTLGAMRNGVERALADDEKVAGFTYTCWDPYEEFDLGYFADFEHPRCAGCGKAVRATDELWRAPEGWEHVDIIGPDEPCRHLAGGVTDGYAVRFPNLNAVTYKREGA